jgi:cyclophilin family peptidyl-prolyl cis-trans isomerase
VPKQKKREQHHLRQTPARRRSYTIGGTAPAEKYKAGFPMNLLANVKAFYVIGAVIMIGGVMIAAVAKSANPSRNAAGVTPTATVNASLTPTGSETPSASVTANPKTFTKAEQVIDAATKQYTATIKMDKGAIVLKLNADVAPNTVNSFVFLAQKGFFDGLTFHRVDKPPFVAQGGDPKGNGTGGPGYQTQDEPTQVHNTRGAVSMAKSSGATGFGSQFFINLKDNVSLDFDNKGGDKFYPFAEVTSGMDVVDKLAVGDVMRSVTIAESPK